jgi:hypothetical protein
MTMAKTMVTRWATGMTMVTAWREPGAGGVEEEEEEDGDGADGELDG